MENVDEKVTMNSNDSDDFIAKPAQDEINTFKESKVATACAHKCDENDEYIMKMPKHENERLTLTGVYLITNKDGVHTEKELIGYIDQHPFVVLHQLLSKYYISGYLNDNLYPIFMAGYKYSLFIKEEGDSYSYANIGKIKIKDIDVFCSRFNKIELAGIDNKYSEEYLNLLSMATNSNPDLQEAIDLQGYEILGDTIVDFSNLDIHNKNKLLLQSYKMAQIMDNYINE